MTQLGLEAAVVDAAVRDRAVAHLAARGVVLPTFAQLADPATIPAAVHARLTGVDPDGPDAANLFRIHWHNAEDPAALAEVPDHLVLPPSLTGVEAPIVVLLGDRFPMIHAHKVLAAYGCLAPRIVTGQFDPVAHRAVWPSTGNYCRGGIAVSRILGCHGVAVLPEGMSRERFDWLARWVADPADVVRTPGTESNVKEIYDRCAELERDPRVVVFNQFAEFGNYLAHFTATGRAVERTFASLARRSPGLRLAAFVSATGSAGTLGAGDYLREAHGARVVAVEALECPTLIANGFGEHNIQGIGDKHVPLIHNVMGTDVLVAVSDRVTDGLYALCNAAAGRDYLVRRRGVPAPTVAALGRLGFSGFANVVAAIKVARFFKLDAGSAVVTVATDGGAMYASELAKILPRDFPGGFDEVAAGETWGRCLAGIATDHVAELTFPERERVFNLGYYTWVEQQGVALHDFEARRHPAFWRALRDLPAAWDELIDDFNGRAGRLG